MTSGKCFQATLLGDIPLLLIAFVCCLACLIAGIALGYLAGQAYERDRISKLTLPCPTCGGSGWDPKGSGTNADVCPNCGAQQYMPLWLFFGQDMKDGGKTLP